VVAHPNADNFMLHILLCFAEKERQDISDRTKAALAAARERGQRLGSPNSCANQKNRSVAFAEGLRGIVASISHLPSRQIAAALNAQGVVTPTGGAWSSVTVLRLIDRLNLKEAA
jgi:DNA invertase Pin-like site-specific DNA recombinase